MLINTEKQIFVGKRIDNAVAEAWQMPQGGVDFGETEEHAMFRELREETGIPPEDVSVLAKSEAHYYYNLPYQIRKKLWDGKYLGQKQRWYLIKLISDESSIDIKTHHPEFSDWKWIAKEEILEIIVPFKRELYSDLISEFKPYL